MKKIFLTALLVTVLLSTITFITFSNGEKEGKMDGKMEKQFVTVVTGGTGGTYYPIGTIFANLWNQKLGDKGIKASAQSSGGSVENLSMLQTKEAQLGIAVGALASDAQMGQNSFTNNEYPEVRLVTGLYPEIEQFVVTKSSGITSIADIKGKRFSVGDIGSGAERSALSILETIAGLTTADFKDEHLGFSVSSAAMQNGQLDAMMIEGGVPTSAVAEIAASNTPVMLLSISESDFEKMRNVNPSWGYFTIPAGTYTNIDTDTKSVGIRSALVTDASVDEELIYQLVKTLYDNMDSIRSGHAVLSYVTKEDAVKNLPAIKLHSGALRYFEEEGIKIPAGMK